MSHLLLFNDDILKDEMGYEWHYGRSTDTYPSSIDTTDFPIGTSSLNLNGNYLYTEHSASQLMHNKEFTVDFYFKYIKQQSYYIPLFSLYGSSTSNGYKCGGCNITTRVTNQFVWYANVANASGGLGANISNGDYIQFCTVGNGIWYHVALVRDANGFYGFINGSRCWFRSLGLSTSIYMFNNYMFIGFAGPYANASYSKICNFRVSNIARWTTNFTPPTEFYEVD